METALTAIDDRVLDLEADKRELDARIDELEKLRTAIAGGAEEAPPPAVAAPRRAMPALPAARSNGGRQPRSSG